MISLKTGDTRPLDVVLKRGRSVIDLTDAEVVFAMGRQNGLGDGIGGDCQVLDDPELGQVRYEWAAGETDDAGLYYAEWRITRAGEDETVPSEGYEAVRISDAVD